MASSDQGSVEVGVGELTEVRAKRKEEGRRTSVARHRRWLARFSLARRRFHRANSFFFLPLPRFFSTPPLRASGGLGGNSLPPRRSLRHRDLRRRESYTSREKAERAGKRGGFLSCSPSCFLSLARLRPSLFLAPAPSASSLTSLFLSLHPASEPRNEKPQMLDRLRLRRQAVETELSLLPSAPKSTKDIFQLCRGFERAFSLTVDSTEYAAHIRNAFQEGAGASGPARSSQPPAGLAAAIRALPLERMFRLDPVKAVVRECDGFQPHLVSPELGLRKLVGDALAMVERPVETCIHRIHAVLVSAAREAAAKASLLADSPGLDARREPLRLPAFERAVVGAATKALEGWRDEALKVAKTIVDMERSYVTAAFFRQRTMERVEAMSGGGGGGE